MSEAARRTAYEGLVREHAAGLWRLAYRLAGEPAAADDLVQETYLHAWRSIGGLRDLGAARAWLVTILRRRWMHALRDASRRPRLESGEVDEEASPLPGPDLEAFARRECVQQALGRLDPRLKEAFLLVFLEDFTCAEAAAQLGVPLGTVLSRVHRARARLRVLLRDPPAAGEARTAQGGAS